MDILYVPDHVYRLSPSFVAELNRVRDELSSHVIDPEYNSAVYTRVLTAVQKLSPSPHAVLDFGCGNGAAGPFIHRLFPASRIYGFDIRPARTIPLYVDIAVGEASSPFPYPDSSFDVCLAFFVLQFRVFDEQLMEIARTLRPGGILAFNLINSADYEVLDRIHECGFTYRSELDIRTALNTGRGFIFLKNP
jgi:SAM-dependent methyltransferase